MALKGRVLKDVTVFQAKSPDALVEVQTVFREMDERCSDLWACRIRSQGDCFKSDIILSVVVIGK
jgi:hypothetical protein